MQGSGTTFSTVDLVEKRLRNIKALNEDLRQQKRDHGIYSIYTTAKIVHELRKLQALLIKIQKVGCKKAHFDPVVKPLFVSCFALAKSSPCYPA